jgi:hypothetical protein
VTANPLLFWAVLRGFFLVPHQAALRELEVWKAARDTGD